MAVLHFSQDELAGRRRRACEKMAKQGLDAVLLFKQGEHVLPYRL